MDVKEFIDARDSQLAAFEKQYSYLKSQYSTALSAAIQETDPEKQQSLIQQVLSVNQELSSQLKEILSVLNKGQDKYDTTTLQKLTQDLINYQKEYEEVQKSNDKLNTLKILQNTTSENLSSAQTMYYFYLGALILLCFYIVYLLIRLAWSSPTMVGGFIENLVPRSWQRGRR